MYSDLLSESQQVCHLPIISFDSSSQMKYSQYQIISTLISSVSRIPSAISSAASLVYPYAETYAIRIFCCVLSADNLHIIFCILFRQINCFFKIFLMHRAMAGTDKSISSGLIFSIAFSINLLNGFIITSK